MDGKWAQFKSGRWSSQSHSELNALINYLLTLIWGQESESALRLLESHKRIIRILKEVTKRNRSNRQWTVFCWVRDNYNQWLGWKVWRDQAQHHHCPSDQTDRDWDRTACVQYRKCCPLPGTPTHTSSLSRHSGHLRGWQIGTHTKPLHMHLHGSEPRHFYLHFRKQTAAQKEWLGNKNRFPCTVWKV